MESTKVKSSDAPPKSQRKQKDRQESKKGQETPAVYETSKVKKQQYRFENVFDASVNKPDQIVDTYIAQTEHALIGDERLSYVITNPLDISQFSPHEQAFSKQFRSFADECKLNQAFMIVDYTIKNGRKDTEIDSQYANEKQDASVWTNIREGNTLLESYDPKNFSKLLSVTMLRQGLPRFFKLHYDAIAQDRSKLCKGGQSIVEQYMTLAQVKQSLLHGNRIEIRKQIKTNGDNAQISWCLPLTAWVIASKNVAIVARNNKDVTDFYPEKSRYGIARSIAICWFKIIDSFTPQNLSSLKDEMHNKTFVGEFVGKKELVNLIKYPKETIIFHAVVQNTRIASNAPHNAYCLHNSIQILKSFSLEVVPTTTFGPYDDYNDLCDALVNIYDEVASSTLASSEEGAVLYFVQISQDKSHRDSVISMAKVKSPQYLSLKLIQSTLENALADNFQTNFESNFQQFIKNLKALQHNAKKPSLEKFYAELFSSAFSLVAKRSEQDMEMYRNLLMNDRIKFFALVMKHYEEKNGKDNAEDLAKTIDFESQLLSGNQFHIGTQGHRKVEVVQPVEAQPTFKPKTEQAPKAKKEHEKEVKPKQTPRTKTALKGEVRVLIVPPLGMKKSIYETLAANYNICEQLKANSATFAFTGDQRKNLVIVNSFENLPLSAPDTTFNYSLFGLKKSTKPDDIAKNVYLKDEYRVSNELKDTVSAQFIRQEVVKMLASAQAFLQQQSTDILVRTEDELYRILDISREKPAKVTPNIEPETIQAKPEIAEVTHTPSREVKVVKKVVEQVKNNNGGIYVFFPIGIPGMGKTHFATHYLGESLKSVDDKGRFTIISQDMIRKQCLDKWMKENRGSKSDEGLKTTTKEASEKYSTELQEALARASASKVNQYIFLDKNYPPAEFLSTLNAINAFEEQDGTKINKIALMPHIENAYADFPFSLGFFLQCYLRCLNRKGHVTISNDDPERIVKILVLFFTQFKNIRFDSSFLSKGFDQIMPANLTIESEFQVPRNLEKMIKQIIEESQNKIEGNLLISQFCEAVDVYRQVFGSCDSSKGAQKSISETTTAKVGELIKAQGSQVSKKQPAENNVKKAVQTAAKNIKNETIVEKDNEDSDNNQLIPREVKPELIKRDQIKPAENETQNKRNQEKKAPPAKEAKETKGPTKTQPVAEKQDLKTPNVSVKPVEVKEETKQRVTATPKQVAQAETVYKTYRAAKQPRQASDGFETVVSKRKHDLDASSDNSDSEEPMPVLLGIRIAEKGEVRRCLREMLSPMLGGAVVKKMAGIDQDDLNLIKKLLQSSSKLNHNGGWQLANEIVVPCLNVERDEEIAENSRIFASFARDQDAVVTVSAVIYVREKILIAIAEVEGQDVEEKIPVMILAKNGWFKRSQASGLAERACLKTQPFKGLYDKILAGKEITDEEMFATGEVAISGGRDAKTVTAHMFVLRSSDRLVGHTIIQ